MQTTLAQSCSAPTGNAALSGLCVRSRQDRLPWAAGLGRGRAPQGVGKRGARERRWETVASAAWASGLVEERGQRELGVRRRQPNHPQTPRATRRGWENLNEVGGKQRRGLWGGEAGSSAAGSGLSGTSKRLCSPEGRRLPGAVFPPGPLGRQPTLQPSLSWAQLAAAFPGNWC